MESGRVLAKGKQQNPSGATRSGQAQNKMWPIFRRIVAIPQFDPKALLVGALSACRANKDEIAAMQKLDEFRKERK